VSLEHWTTRLPLDEALERWLREAHNSLTNGARLAARVDREGDDSLGSYGGFALLFIGG